MDKKQKRYINYRKQSSVDNKMMKDLNSADPFAISWIREEYELTEPYFADHSLKNYKQIVKAALRDILREKGWREKAVGSLEQTKERMIRSVAEKLETIQVQLYVGKSQTRKRLTTGNIPTFEDQVVNRRFFDEDRVCAWAGENSYMKSFCRDFTKQDPRLAVIKRGLKSREYCGVIIEFLQNKRINVNGYLQNEIIKYFDLECCFEHLKRNKKLQLEKYITDREESRRSVRKHLLERIPDSYVDLYPDARLMKRKFIIHHGPTNSGKTHDSLERLKSADHGLYAGPLRLLAYEIYDRLNRSGVYCSMRTGEERIDVPGYTVMSSTVEMVNLSEEYDVAVIDEAQLVADPLRGGAWTRAILGVRAKEIHLCCSPDALTVLCRMITDCGDTYKLVEHQRNTPLLVDDREFEFPKSVEPHDALIVFSRKMVYVVAEELRERGWSVSMIYGDLPYDVRHKEAAKFIKGESQVLVSTDAIGLGLNLPIKRVVFLKTVKFDGYSMRPLTAGEVKQIGGRAGRFGIYNEGYVCAEGDNAFISSRIYADTPEIQYATIQFPETIIDIDAPMLDILLRWKDITVNAGYRKADIEREIKLCKMLEPVVPNKMFIYTAITTPFDEKEKTLLDLWFDMVVAEYRNESLLEEVFEIYSEKFSKKLDKLELTYHIFDLLYNFSIKFNHPELSEPILRKKTQLSDEIIYRMSLFEKNKKHSSSTR